MPPMAPTPVQGPAARAGQLAFFAGLALIALATVHNIAFDGMNQANRMTLPSYLAETYDHYGKLGVTLGIVILGLIVMLCGFLFQWVDGRHQPDPRASRYR